MKIAITIYRALLIIIFLALFGWLAYQNAVVDGKFHIEKDFCIDSRFISYLYPDNRMGVIEKDISEKCFQRIFVEPAYFKVKIPRTFVRVSVKIVYSNPDQDIIQLGIMKKKIDPMDWRFTLKLVENKIFDNLDWFKLSEQGVTLWQKEKKFNRIHDYVNNVPVDQKTVTFYYGFSKEAVKNPTKVVGWNTKTSLEYVDYIITEYISPKIIDGDWKEQILEFSAGSDYMNDHYLEFIISAPGLTESRNEIKIARIEIDLTRPKTDWQTFLFDIKNYFLRKLSKL